MENLKTNTSQPIEAKVEDGKMKNKEIDKIIGHLEHVGVEQISTYLRQQGVIVQEHIGRMRVKFTLSPEALGINQTDKTDEVKNFIAGHLDLGKLFFIPKHLDNQLQKIEQRVRNERKLLAIGYDDKYMPMASFDKFNEKIKKQHDEYMLVRDSITSQWSVIVDNFKKDLSETLESLNAINKDVIFQKVISSIPSKEAYAASFYMYATVKAFPVPENMEMFSPSMQEMMTKGIEEDTLNTLNQVLVSTLNDALHSLNLVLKGYRENHIISKKAMDSIKTASKKIKEKNILGHPKIEEIVEQLNQISYEQDMFDAFTLAEALSYMIYGFAKDLNLLKLLDLHTFVLSKAEMEASYELYYQAD